jgi:hypothetical protein
MRVEPAVSALVYSLVRDAVPEDVRSIRFRENDAVRFVVAQVERMPDHLRLGIVVLTWLFDQSARASTLRPFHALAPEARARHVDAWRSARLAPMRRLVRFYESLAVFGWYASRDREGHP